MSDQSHYPGSAYPAPDHQPQAYPVYGQPAPTYAAPGYDPRWPSLTADAVAKAAGRAQTAMVLGIVSLATFFLPLIGIVSPVLAVIAVVFGHKSRSRLRLAGQPTGKATAGLVMGYVAIGLFALFFAVGFAIGFTEALSSESVPL